MILMVTNPAVPAMFAADVVAMDPMMSNVRHVPGNPDHLIVAVPITCAVVVKGPVPDLDFNSIRSNEGGEKHARHQNGREQKFIFDHPLLIMGRRHPPIPSE